MKSVMKHQFSQVPQATIPRSSFDRSHGHKTTFDAGLLIPIFVDEALPGDTFNLNMTAFARMATPIKPIMDNLYMETFFFAVPYRLVWDGWVKMMGEVDIDDDTAYTTPQVFVESGNAIPNQIADYMGLPIYAEGDWSVSALPLRAYNLIYNEWFRDQNLSPMRPVNKDQAGPDDPSDYSLMYRAKRHDYFTSCLPWPQKGEDVTIPTLGYADVIAGVPNQGPMFGDATTGGRRLRMTNNVTDVTWEAPPDATGTAVWANPNLRADLSTASAVTINDLRTAFQYQKLLERDARGGTRYTEIIRAHFGVTSPDARLQRPEFLGGGSTRINVKPVEQTSETGTSNETPQGNLAATATANLNNHGFTKSFTEHCVVIGLVNVRADLTYQNGINRMWMRQTKYDYYWPALAHLGEQEVYDFEIFAVRNVAPETGDEKIRPAGPGPLAEDAIFGYQERFAEYRYKPSLITGNFRSDHAQSLDIWHLSQDFNEVPLLNDVFISDVPPVDRVIATPGEPHFLFDAYFDFKCARPMPLYGVPGNIDRF